MGSGYQQKETQGSQIDSLSIFFSEFLEMAQVKPRAGLASFSSLNVTLQVSYFSKFLPALQFKKINQIRIFKILAFHSIANNCSNSSMTV